jgi:hypothetical protein
MGCASVKEFDLYLYYTNFSRKTGHARRIYIPFFVSSLSHFARSRPIDKVFHWQIFGNCDERTSKLWKSSWDAENATFRRSKPSIWSV